MSHRTRLDKAALEKPNSELLLTQFPTGFDVARLTDLKLRLHDPDASGEIARCELASGETAVFTQEAPSFAAQLFAAAAPATGCAYPRSGALAALTYCETQLFPSLGGSR